MLAFNSVINKYVYNTKSQFLFFSEMLKMKLSLKFGKIIRNCLRNSAVSLGNHNENYNALANSQQKSIDTTLFEHRSQQKPFKWSLD